MVKIEMVLVTCGKCEYMATRAVKVQGDPSCPPIEIYCSAHAEERMKILAAHYKSRDIEFVDTTYA